MSVPLPSFSVNITRPTAAVSGAFTVSGTVTAIDFENGIGAPKLVITLPSGNTVQQDVNDSNGNWSIDTAVPAGLRGADSFTISVTASWHLSGRAGSGTQTRSDSRTFSVSSVNPPRLAITSSPALPDAPGLLDQRPTSLPMPFTVTGTMTEGDARITIVQWALDTGAFSTVPGQNNWATWQIPMTLDAGYHRIRIQAIDHANKQANLEKWILVHGTPDLVDNHSASITSWTRLEPQVRTTDMGRAVSARLFDPTWMLTRQWQMGEFQGEDTGTPVSARVRATNAPVTRYALGQIPTTSVAGTRYDATQTPLETIVERRPARPATLTDPRMLTFTVDAGLHFMHMLDQAGLSKSYRPGFSSKYPLPQLPTPAPYAVDDATNRFVQLMAGRAPDARQMAAAFRSGGSATVVTDASLAIAAADQPKVKTAADNWVIWYDSIVSEPASATDSGWNPARLEYAVSVAGALSAQATDEITLSAAEIDDGRLDWSNFDVNPTVKLGSAGDRPVTSLVETTIPAPVSFRGMPAVRFWELEDSKIAYGLMSVGPTDLAHLMMIEFASSYGNDWFVVPLTIPVGSLTRVDSLVVTDTFGVQRLLRPLGSAGVPATNFSMWQQSAFRRAGDPSALATGPSSATPNLFFLSPSLGRVDEGAALEDVVIMRDEMASMAWAIERTVENPIEQPSSRADAAAPAPTALTPSNSGAPKYLLASTVPDNWIPLMPVRVQQTSAPDQLWLQRAALLQPDGTQPTINQTHTDAMAGPSPMRIYDEEVPREGARITRSRRLTRWTDGSFWVWTALRRQTGNGEGSSGLKYDQLQSPNGGGSLSPSSVTPPTFGTPNVAQTTLTIAGASSSLTATLTNPGPSILNAVVQLWVVQDDTRRAMIEAFVDCGVGPGAVPQGTSTISMPFTISNTGDGAGTLITGAATLELHLVDAGNVLATSDAVSVTLVVNAPPTIAGLTLSTATPYITSVGLMFVSSVVNLGIGLTGVATQGWIVQGASRRATGGMPVTCGTNPSGVLPNGTFVLSGSVSISNAAGGTGTLIPGPASFELDLVDNTGAVIATRTYSVTLQPNTPGIVTLATAATSIPIGSSTAVFSATVRNPGASLSNVVLQGYVNQGTTRHAAGGSVILISGSSAGVLPTGTFPVGGSIVPMNQTGVAGTLVAGPATFELQMTMNGTLLELKTIPIVLA